MKSKIGILFALIVLTLVSKAICQGGEISHDPWTLAELKAQHVVMINQTAELKDQLIEMKKNVLNTAAIAQGVGDLTQDFKEIYNNTFGLIGELARLHEEIVSTPDDIEAFFKEFKDIIDCAIDDLDSYGRAEKIYEARYVFKGRDNGTPQVKWDDRYVGEYYSAGVDSFSALNQNPCGFSVDAYSILKRKAEQEKRVLKDAIEKNSKTAEEIKKTKERFDQLAEKVEETESLKETVDTNKAILFEMLMIQKQMEKHLRNLVILQYGREHERTLRSLESAKHVSKDQLKKDKALGVKYNSNQQLNSFFKKIKNTYLDKPPAGTSPFIWK